MLIIVTLVVLAFGLGAVLGAPYLPVLKNDRQQLLKLADLQKGQLVLDLGCGDGRFLKAAAKQGVKGIGYEINPILWLMAKINTFGYRRQIQIKLANFWHIKLPAADAVYVFLIARYMAKLGAKLEAEITRPTKVVSYIFAIPNHKPVVITKNSYVYVYPKSSV